MKKYTIDKNSHYKPKLDTDCKECGGLGYTMDPFSDDDYPCVTCALKRNDKNAM